ncbi:hypothetical protein F971_00810 [Acinetobacter vivianii]|uniref:Tyr recombinase domain-containing protein n=1 Tax=Acinetobacter vivianii TaxID=1776742 RepID=N8WE95_9GAMM|nr:site-specific integrase [Acinetobacter vivianii]ENU93552.1 hypothetical protein F971_00810 [Acinetobacter vivianii]
MSMKTIFGERYFYRKNPRKDSKIPYLVFDFEANLHLPLTHFSAYLSERYAPNTLKTYTYELISFFSWYHNKNFPQNSMFWAREPEQVRNLVSEYLFIKLKCQIRTKENFNLVYLTKGSPKTVGILLAALSSFYNSVVYNKLYKFDNPLVSTQFKLDSNESSLINKSNHPIMPYVSGVTEIKKTKRLTDTYFILTNKEWTPHIVNDNDLPNRIFNAGKKVGWSTRQNLITMLLFETGARISEVCGITLGDWYARGLSNEATSFSKGSSQRRVKFIRWSNNTTKLLRSYFNNERFKCDKKHLKLIDYINLAKEEKINLYDVQIFITNTGTPLKPNVYRDLYWSIACKKTGIILNIHQIRHWYVSKIIEEIQLLNLSNHEYERKVDELIKYMNWKSGRETLKVYEHYFSEKQYALLHDNLHKKLNKQLKSQMCLSDKKNESSYSKTHDIHHINTDDSELDFLWGLGGF